MANSGPDTNGSQLYEPVIMIIIIGLYYSFITFRSCMHLDKKHTIFGRYHQIM